MTRVNQNDEISESGWVEVVEVEDPESAKHESGRLKELKGLKVRITSTSSTPSTNKRCYT